MDLRRKWLKSAEIGGKVGFQRGFVADLRRNPAKFAEIEAQGVSCEEECCRLRLVPEFCGSGMRQDCGENVSTRGHV